MVNNTVVLLDVLCDLLFQDLLKIRQRLLIIFGWLTSLLLFFNLERFRRLWYFIATADKHGWSGPLAVKYRHDRILDHGLLFFWWLLFLHSGGDRGRRCRRVLWFLVLSLLFATVGLPPIRSVKRGLTERVAGWYLLLQLILLLLLHHHLMLV